MLGVWRVCIEAQAGGVLLPGGIGGDALRVAYVLGQERSPDESAPRLPIVVASVLLDRVIGLALIAAVAAALATACHAPAIGADPAMLLGVLWALPIGVFAALVILRLVPSAWAPSSWLPGRLRRPAEALLGPMMDYVRDGRAPSAMAGAAALSLVVAAAQFGVIRGLVMAVGAQPTAEQWIYVGSAMAFIVSAVPSLPGAWGTADATYVFFFGLGGIQPASALAVCLLYRLFWYFSGVVGALLRISRWPRRRVLERSSP
jgi:uncharacterized membrane protein YbhN (UPF0104 family)